MDEERRLLQVCPTSMPWVRLNASNASWDHEPINIMHNTVLKSEKFISSNNFRQQTKTRSFLFIFKHFHINAHIINNGKVCCIFFNTFHWVFVCITRRWQCILFPFIFSALPSRTIRKKGKEVDALSDHLTAAHSVASARR